MKKFILIALLICLSGSAFGQLVLPPPFDKPLSLYTKTGILQSLGNTGDTSSQFLRIDGTWQPASGGGVTVPLVLRQDTADRFLTYGLLLNNQTANTGGGQSSPGIKFTNKYRNSTSDNLFSDWYLYGYNSSDSGISTLSFMHLLNGNTGSNDEFDLISDSIQATEAFRMVNAYGSGGSLTIVCPSNQHLTLAFPLDGGSPNQVLTTDGTGVTTFKYVLGGYVQVDTTINPVQYPSVTDGTKSFALGDSSSASGFESIAEGNNTLASGYKSISIGNGITDAFVGGNYLWATGDYSIIMGTSGKVQSLGSIGIGDGVTDVCTYNDKTNFLGGGNNTLIGTSTYNDTGSFNSCYGWAASCFGRSSEAYGDGAVAWRGCNNISLGSNSGAGSQTGVHSRQIFISSVDVVTDNNVSHFDSTTLINGHNLIARNAGAYYFGYGNTTATNALFVIGNGGVYGNALTSDALFIARNGTVTAGNNFVAATALGSATTPTAGTFAKDNAIIAWGNIAADATINSQYGNFGIAHTGSSGIYTITLPTTPSENCGIVSLQGSTLGLSSAIAISGATITIKTGVGAVATDEAFYFVVTGRP